MSVVAEVTLKLKIRPTEFELPEAQEHTFIAAFPAQANGTEGRYPSH